MFGGVQWDDSQRFAQEMFSKEIDLTWVKHRLYGSVQASHVEYMDLITKMETASRGSSEQAGFDHTTGGSETAPRIGDALAGSQTSSFSDAYRRAMSGFTSEGSAQAVAQSVPVVLPDEVKKELRSVQFWSLDEQLFLLARDIHNQPRQHAAAYKRGDTAHYIRIADVDDPLWDMDEVEGYDANRLGALAALPDPIVAPRAVIEEETHERLLAFRQRPSLPPSTAEVLDVSDEADPIQTYRAGRKKVKAARRGTKKPPIG